MKFFLVVAALLITAIQVFAADSLIEGFKDESELGTAIVIGNSSSETYNAKQTNEYTWSGNVTKFTGHYLQARANGVESARAWDATLRYERQLTDVFNLFIDYGLESDIFSGYVQRNYFDLGGKYFFIKDPELTWFAEAGYRYSTTHYPSASQPDISNSSLRVYTEANKSINKSATFKLWVEYIPAIVSSQTGAANSNYSISQDYLVNVEPSVSVMLSQILSLKTAYLFKYKNYLPPGSTATKYLDTLFTTSLVAKF